MSAVSTSILQVGLRSTWIKENYAHLLENSSKFQVNHLHLQLPLNGIHKKTPSKDRICTW